MTDPNEIDELGRALIAIKPRNAGTIIVSIAAHGGDADTPDGSITVTMARHGREPIPAHAATLSSALFMAEAKLDKAERKEAAAKAEAKA